MKHELIGNKRKGRLEELMKKADNDPLINEVVEEKEQVQKKQKSGSGFLKLHPCDEARKLIQGIEKKIGFKQYDDGKLVNRSSFDTAYSIDNALLAIAYLGLGEREKAEELINCTEQFIGFSKKHKGLINNWEKSDDYIEAAGNAALATAYIGLGRIADAVNLIKNIESKFLDDNGLIIADSHFNTASDNNVLMALAYISIGKGNTAFRIMKLIEERIGFEEIKQDKLLRKSYKETGPLFTRDSALMATLYYFLNKPEKGKDLIRSIANRIEIIEEDNCLMPDLFYVDKMPNRSPNFQSHSNSSLAIAYMAKEYYEKHGK